MEKTTIFLELQDHGIPDQKTGQPGASSDQSGTGHSPLSARTISIIPMKTDVEAHDVLLCIQTGKEDYG